MTTSQTIRGDGRTTTSALRVLHVMTEPRGGGGVHVRELARAGAAAGQAVTLAVPSLRGGDDPAGMGVVALARAMRAADIVHCHGVRAALALPPMRPGGRMAVTTHGLHGLRGPTGARGQVVRALTRAALGRADAIVCVSDDDALEVAALSPRLASRCRTITNGVAPLPLATAGERSSARRALGLATDDHVLLLVGSLIHQKHPELAVEAVVRARRELPGLVLLVAGDGPLMADLRGLDAQGAWLLGQRSDVHSLMAAADVVLNTSRWEGLSLALLEALWRGRPLLATDSPGNPEAVGDAGLVAPADPDALAEAIVRLATEPGLLDALAARARPRAETLFDARRMVDETLALHSEVAA